MFLSDLSIKRPVLMSMVLLVFVLFGIVGYNNMPLTLMPQINTPVVTVRTIYSGTAPREIESQITKKIEDEVASVSLIDRMVSYSMDSVSIIQIVFEFEKDENIALQEVKDKVDQVINNLPDGAEQPVVQKLDLNASSVVDIVMEGNLPATRLYQIADNKVKERLAQIAGVGKVDLIGGEEREIRVELDKRVVYENAISQYQIAAILGSANLDMPGGNFKEGGQEYSVRLKGEFPSLEALREFNVPTANGLKKLWQLADVKDSVKEVRQRVVFFNNRTKKRNNNSILLTVVKSPLANTVQTVAGVMKVLPEIEKEIGHGITLTVAKEESTFVKNTADDAFGNIYLGVLLTALILLVFLHDLRSTLIVAISMPMSIIPTFIVMNALGISLNAMSLMGLSTASGILVANSVVVLENIFRRKTLGEDRKQAAAFGTAEVTTAVIASTLTNIVVFLPIGTMPGLVGIIFKDFALTVVVATIFSIISSFTATPMLASLILPDQIGKKNRFGAAFDRFFQSFATAYRKLLQFILASKRRSSAVVGLTLLLFIGAILLFTTISIDFVPALDTGSLEIIAELPQGYDLNETAGLLQKMEDRVRRHDEVINVLTTLGKVTEMDQGVNMAKMKVKLVAKKERKISDKELASIMTRELAEIANAKIRIAAVSGFSITSAPVDFFLKGQNLGQLEKYAATLEKKLQKVPGLMNLNTSTRAGKPEITIYPDRVKMSEAGLSMQELALLLRTSIEGVKVSEYKESGNEYEIRVVLNKESLPRFEDLENLPVATKIGIFPVSHFAKLKFTSGYNKILHSDKYVTIEFTADTSPGYTLGDITKAVDQAVAEMRLPSGYFMKWGGFADLMYDMLGNMAFAFILAIILTFMLLAATVENFGQPLLILATVPLCLIGVTIALLVTGVSLSIVSMLSIVMLVGMVVNNAILILDYTNQLRANGMDLRSALLEACPAKLMPILMSNLAAILGMLPMALGIGAFGAEIRQPMGIVSIGGILSSTVLTLVVIPAAEILIGKKRSVKANPNNGTEPIQVKTLG
jgi:HAE1 family hydrophobic/amphiphilic exporter-1